MSLVNLYGPLLFIIGMAAMFLVVPWRRIKELFLVGLNGGIVVGIVLIYLMQNILGFWVYPGPSDLVLLAGLPVFLIISWFPFIIVFAHLLAQYNSPILRGLIVLAFPAGAVLTHILMINDGALFYSNWSLFGTFLLSLAIHLGIALALHGLGRLENVHKIP